MPAGGPTVSSESLAQALHSGREALSSAPSSKRYSLRSRLLLLAATLVGLVIAAELLVRLAYPHDRLEYVVDDEVLWLFRPGQSGTFERKDGLVTRETVNQAGFRGPLELLADDPRPRVLALGDSYTWGWGVNDEETWPARLAAGADQHWQVVNGGVPGWGVFQAETRLRRVIRQVRPAVVVLLLVEGDIYRQPYANEAKKRAQLRQSRLRHAVRSISRLVTVTARWWEGLRLARAGQAVANERPRSGNAFERYWQADRARLSAMAATCRENSAELIVVGWPQGTNDTAFFLADLAAWGQAEGVTTLDLSPTLAPVPRSERVIPNDGHPNAKGQQLTADSIRPLVAATLARDR